MKTQLGVPRIRSLQATQALNLYLWIAMALLFVQGGGSLILRLNPGLEAVTPTLLATLMNGNLPHGILHVVWGAVGLVYLALEHADRARLALAFTFGTFYTLLGFLGIVVSDPFGLRLAWQENLFHLTVGPLMLVLAFLAWRMPTTLLWGRSRTAQRAGGG